MGQQASTLDGEGQEGGGNILSAAMSCCDSERSRLLPGAGLLKTTPAHIRPPQTDAAVHSGIVPDSADVENALEKFGVWKAQPTHRAEKILCITVAALNSRERSTFIKRLNQADRPQLAVYMEDFVHRWHNSTNQDVEALLDLLKNDDVGELDERFENVRSFAQHGLESFTREMKYQGAARFKSKGRPPSLDSSGPGGGSDSSAGASPTGRNASPLARASSGSGGSAVLRRASSVTTPQGGARLGSPGPQKSPTLGGSPSEGLDRTGSPKAKDRGGNLEKSGSFKRQSQLKKTTSIK